MDDDGGTASREGGRSSITPASSSSIVGATDKLIVLGTFHGMLHVVDGQGNEVKSFSLHSSRIVSQLSFDDSGQHLAACCGGEGAVAVVDLFGDNVVRHPFNQQAVLEAVAMDPNFSETGRVVAGGLDGQLILKDARRTAWSWPRLSKDEVLFSGGGTILDIQWRKGLIAWFCYDDGLKIMDLDTRQLLPFVEIKQHHQEQQQQQVQVPRGCRPYLVWHSDSVLLLACGNRIKVVAIRELGARDETLLRDFARRDLEDFGLAGLKLVPGMKYVETVSFFRRSKYDTICGLAPYRGNGAVVVGLDRRGKEPTVLEVLTWRGKVLYSETLPSGYKQLRPQDFALACSPGDSPIYYVLSPESLLVRDLEGQRAVAISRGDQQVRTSSILEVMLNALATSSNVEDHKKLLSHLRSWARDSYSSAAVSSTLEFCLQNEDTTKSPYIREALKELYVLQRRFEEALEMYVQLGDPCVFQFVEQRELQGALAGKIEALTEISHIQAVELLVRARRKVPPSQVVSELTTSRTSSSRRALESYLWSLFKQDPEASKAFHNLQVELHAERGSSCLLEMLRRSNHYDMNRAYEICSKKRHLEGMVLVQARRGKYKEVVELMTNNMHRVAGLMDVVAPFDGVWQVLVMRAKKDPKLMDAVFKHAVGKNHLLNSVSFTGKCLDKEKQQQQQPQQEQGKADKGWASSSSSRSNSRLSSVEHDEDEHEAGVMGDMQNLMDDFWFFNSVLKQEVEKKNPVVAR